MRQVRAPPLSQAEVVCKEALEVLATGMGTTMLSEVSPLMPQYVNCGTAALAVLQIDASTSTSVGLVQRQVSLASYTRRLRMVAQRDEATEIAPQVSPVIQLAVGR